jgi:hypothetical protein
MPAGLQEQFLHEVDTQCGYVADAYQVIRAFFDDPNAGHDVWGAFESLVVAAANLGKLLWGKSPRFDRQPLRDALGIDDASPLHKPPRVRNGFEHIDEKLETWWRRSPGHNLADRNIGPIDHPSMRVFLEDERVRHFDPTTGELWLWGDSISVNATLDAVGAITIRRREMVSTGWRPLGEEPDTPPG